MNLSGIAETAQYFPIYTPHGDPPSIIAEPEKIVNEASLK
jgi:hypothetical protein